MRTATIMLLGLALAGRAQADCPDAPPPDPSSTRSISDVPYSASPAAPCQKEPAVGLEPREGWASESNQTQIDASRAGIIGVAIGTLILFAGADFAICAKHGIDQGTRDFCHNAAPPVLWSGAAVSVLGMGTLAVATWILPSEPTVPHSGLSGGFSLRWAYDAPAR